MIALADITDARRRLAGKVSVTPCAYSPALSELTSVALDLKFENLQLTGSFKERGACNKLESLSDAERRAGVIAASAGNHAQGVAYHARRLGIAATVVMPEATPLVKLSSTRRYGAEVVLHGRSYDEALERARQLCEERALTFIHAFDDPWIMAGQGTIGLELLVQNPELDAIVVPVGGGGLIAGIACAVKESRSDVAVYGVESKLFPAVYDAFKTTTTPAALGKTIADGIAVRKCGTLTLEAIRRYVDDIALVDEEEIAEAILLLLEREKTVVEGAGAVGLAALLHQRFPLQNKKVAVVLSGGNIDVNLVSRIIERGLVKSGRLARLRVIAPDISGQLANLARLVADARANVVDILHDRAFSRVELGETLIEMVLETQGSEHIARVRTLIEAAGFRFEG